MNRSRYIPFERNRYFYGKLLTVRDFMSEQTYFSDKRRLTNRLLFGSGVITGLQVVAVDDKSVSIEAGAALDQLGREIIVPSPVTVKLSNIDGFTNHDYAKNVYLTLSYDEAGKEPVHTVTGTFGTNEEVSEHNRILESYKLAIRETPPAPAALEFDALIEDTSVWYDDGQVRILQTVPRYVEPGTCFELKLTVEKTLQTPHISFEYEPDVQFVTFEGGLVDGKFLFSEPSDGSQAVYSKTVIMRALTREELEEQAGYVASTGKNGKQLQLAFIGVKSGTARLVIGDRLIYELSQVKQRIEIAAATAYNRILEAFHSRSLDRAIESPAEPCIYVAKINLLQMGASYVIDSVQSLPFDDYVVNPSLLRKLQSKEISVSSSVHAAYEASATGQGKQQPQQLAETNDKLAAIEEFPPIEEEFKTLFSYEQPEEAERYTATGIAEISIVPELTKKWYQKRQKNFYSAEIEHGLGTDTPVYITASLSDEHELTDAPVPDMFQRSNTIYSGAEAQRIFSGSEFASSYPLITTAVVQFPKKGSFRIGVGVHKKTERTRIKIRWWAMKIQAETIDAAMSAEVLEEGWSNAAAAASRQE